MNVSYVDVSYVEVSADDAEILADLRVSAMRESLENLGRFDPERARLRFIQNFEPQKTTKIECQESLIGFYMIDILEKEIWLKHLYIAPDFQNAGIGSQVIENVKRIANKKQLSIKLGALKESRSNHFYQKHGFVFSHDEEWDNYYELPSNLS